MSCGGAADADAKLAGLSFARGPHCPAASDSERRSGNIMMFAPARSLVHVLIRTDLLPFPYALEV